MHAAPSAKGDKNTGKKENKDKEEKKGKKEKESSVAPVLPSQCPRQHSTDKKKKKGKGKGSARSRSPANIDKKKIPC